MPIAANIALMNGVGVSPVLLGLDDAAGYEKVRVIKKLIK